MRYFDEQLTKQSGFFLGFLSFLLVVFAALAVISGVAINNYFTQGPLLENKIVIIRSGMGAGEIAHKLEKENVIDNALLFKIAVKLNPDDTYLKAGEYEFVPHMSMASIIQKIKDGKVVDRKITVREGLTSYQVVQLLNEQDFLSGEIKEIPEEGSLLPETYQFTNGDKRTDQIKLMQKSMNEVLDKLWETRQEGLPIKTKEEALILASIVEKETGVGQERTKVAAVFINRLKKGMLLQTDPTVIYALTKGKVQNSGKGPLGRRLLRKDLEVDSLYNTYKYAGLPPSPIANPGRASIAAVLNPDTHDYIYFVAD
ncbi:MAG: aminodeoxychorismate lyase, partial [Micavibrio sp.]|nr:aminodeoxychorismate lyase [Micavibrio sp.]